MKNYPTIQKIKRQIKEEFLKLNEATSEQQIEDLAIDLIDYLGKQLPTQGWMQNKRIRGFFEDNGISNATLMKKIYQKALKLNAE